MHSGVSAGNAGVPATTPRSPNPTRLRHTKVESSGPSSDRGLEFVDGYRWATAVIDDAKDLPLSSSELIGWTRFRRRGVVLAEQRSAGWNWTAHDGSAMRADADDWEVCEETGGASWSVRDDIFRATHEPLGDGRWRRLGCVLARPATADETIETLEGTIHAPAGSWVVRGNHGDIWAVPAEEFDRRYQIVDQHGSDTA